MFAAHRTLRLLAGTLLLILGLGACGGAPAVSDAAAVDGARTDGGGTAVDGTLAPDGDGLADGPTTALPDANPGTTTTIGVTDPQPAGSFSPGYLLGPRLVVPTTVTLRRLGLYSYAPFGPNARLAVYTDVGGAPSARVAVAGPVALVAGVNEVPVTAVVLPPGSYWFMASYDSDASIGQGSSGSVDVQTYGYVGHPADTDPPGVYPVGVSFYDSGSANYWLIVD